MRPEHLPVVQTPVAARDLPMHMEGTAGWPWGAPLRSLTVAAQPAAMAACCPVRILLPMRKHSKCETLIRMAGVALSCPA